MRKQNGQKRSNTLRQNPRRFIQPTIQNQESVRLQLKAQKQQMYVTTGRTGANTWDFYSIINLNLTNE